MDNKMYFKKPNISAIAIRAVIYITTAAVIIFAISMIGYIVVRGLPYISWDFLTLEPSRLNEIYGIAPMIINTLYIVILTLIVCLPFGIGSAIYLAEYAKQGRIISAIRFVIEILAGIPSIVYGLFGLTFFVRALHIGSYSGSMIAGSLTLTLIVLPTMIRATEEALFQVNYTYREAALSMGVSKLYIIRTVLLPCAMPGIAVAIILSVGRMVSESAALLFTAGLANEMPTKILGHIFEPGSSMTVQLYLYSTEGGAPEWVPFAMATILMLIVLGINLLANIIAGIYAKKIK